MNPNQSQPEPHEQAISFDDLEIEETLPVASTGSLKDKVLESISTPQSTTAPFSEPAITYPKTKPVPDLPPPLPSTSPISEPQPVSAPEQKPEPVVETKREVQAEEPAETPQPKKAAVTTAAPPATPATPTAPVADKTEVRKEIESILQSGLTDMYVQMKPEERAAFSKSANETASKLEILITQFKATAKEVLRLIRAWLIKIPQVNKFFLEQASKIKTDEILEMQRQQKKRSRLLH